MERWTNSHIQVETRSSYKSSYTNSILNLSHILRLILLIKSHCSRCNWGMVIIWLFQELTQNNISDNVFPLLHYQWLSRSE